MWLLEPREKAWWLRIQRSGCANPSNFGACENMGRFEACESRTFLVGLVQFIYLCFNSCLIFSIVCLLVIVSLYINDFVVKEVELGVAISVFDKMPKRKMAYKFYGKSCKNKIWKRKKTKNKKGIGWWLLYPKFDKAPAH